MCYCFSIMSSINLHPITTKKFCESILFPFCFEQDYMLPSELEFHSRFANWFSVMCKVFFCYEKKLYCLSNFFKVLIDCIAKVSNKINSKKK